MLDESTTVQDCVDNIAEKIGIKNPEEFSLQKEGGILSLLSSLYYYYYYYYFFLYFPLLS